MGTHYESAIDDIATRLQGVDASLTTSIAEILAAALQELIEAELTGTIGAEHGERTPTRVAQRNGHRTKLLSTPAGDLEVGIPKLRKGSFFPELLEPRRRIDKALWAVRCAPAGSTTSRSCTSGSTRPTSTSATPDRSSPKRSTRKRVGRWGVPARR